MSLVQIFGLVIAAAVLGTSILIAVMGGRFQKVEQTVYSEKGKPWWFYLSFAAYAIFYLAVLVSFITSPDKTWAGWVLVIVIPIGALIKGTLIIFNKKGQEKVTSIEGDQAWMKIALARLILFPLFLVLAYYA